MAADLDTLITSEIPDGRQNLLDSYTNLEKVAEYCENNYFQCENKRAALEETKGYTTQSLASVAYQINTLAYNFLQMLDLQASQLGEMESQVNHIVQTVAIHKEKVARREIGILTTNKSISRQYKIIAPANPERPIKYVRKPIDYSVLDDIGHGVRVAPPQQLSHHVHYAQQGSIPASGTMMNQQITPRQKRPSTAGSSSGQYGQGMVGSSQYAPGGGNAAYGSLGNVSSGAGAGPAPTTKPPTPPQAVIYSSGTLNRSSKDYRTPPVVAPPQVPSNYAPNYPRGDQYVSGSGTLTRQVSSSSGTGKQYGNLPINQAQIQMVHPQMQQRQQPQDQVMDHLRSGSGGGATMPRLSSGSLRSTGSHTSGGGEGLGQPYGSHGGIYGRQQQQSNTLGRPTNMQQQQFLPRQNTPPGSIGSRQSNTPPTASGIPNQIAPNQQGMMTRPSQRPPSPPLPPPPMGGSTGMPPHSQGQNYDAQQQATYMQHMYSRQASELSSNPNFTADKADGNSIYSRQMSASSIASEAATAANSAIYARQQHHQQQQQQQMAAMMRQSSQGSNSSGGNGKSVAFAATTSIGPSTTSNIPNWVPKNFIEKVASIYDYSADKDDELSFSEGDTIYVLKKNDDGWWEGVMNGVTGLFPGNYVEASL